MQDSLAIFDAIITGRTVDRGALSAVMYDADSLGNDSVRVRNKVPENRPVDDPAMEVVAARIGSTCRIVVRTTGDIRLEHVQETIVYQEHCEGEG